jgi:DNA sulfur modification protein DndB
MPTYLPAVRARVGQTEFFSTVLTFGEAARLIQYVEDVDVWTPETPSELKLQRKLNTTRVEKEMVPYLLEAEDRFYSALTVEVRTTLTEKGPKPVSFEAVEGIPGGVEYGKLTLDGTESLYALDGQHRLKSIELAIREKPDLASDHIAVILVPHVNIEQSQTLFSDLNRYARNPSRSISLLFAHRDPIAKVSKVLAQNVGLLRDKVNMESTSLSVNTGHFITLSTLYETVKALLPDDWATTVTDAEVASQAEEQAEVWQHIVANVGEWRMVEEESEHPAYLRQALLNMHGVGQRAIVNAVARLRSESKEDWTKRLSGLSVIDWQIKNSEWQNVAVQGGRVNNTSTSVKLLTAAVEKKLGLIIDKELDEVLGSEDNFRRPIVPRKRRISK